MNVLVDEEAAQSVPSSGDINMHCSWCKSYSSTFEAIEV
jgi:hypothetical protein